MRATLPSLDETTEVQRGESTPGVAVALGGSDNVPILRRHTVLSRRDLVPARRERALLDGGRDAVGGARGLGAHSARVTTVTL